MALRYLCCICISTAVVFAAVGCSRSKPAGSPLQSVWESPPPAGGQAPNDPLSTSHAVVAAGDSQPAAPDGAASRPAMVLDRLPPEETVAFVNGEPVSREKLTEMLLESRGVAILEQLILLTAARQKAAAMSITVTASDIKDAEDRALRRIAAPVGDPEAMPLDRPTAERLLEDFLRIKGLSTTEWNCRIEQLAYLDRIAQAEVAKMEVTEQMLKDEYALVYGERVQIRHIQASGQDSINRASELLKTKPFAEVARELSENPITREQGGLMPAFTRHDGAVPPLVRERAFAMKPGETSEPLREGAYYHIIQIERTFPASSVGFENVDRDKLHQGLVDRLVHQRTEALDAELFQTARIDIRDRSLSRQFREKHRRK